MVVNVSKGARIVFLVVLSSSSIGSTCASGVSSEGYSNVVVSEMEVVPNRIVSSNFDVIFVLKVEVTDSGLIRDSPAVSVESVSI